MIQLEETLKNEFPELSVDISSIPTSADIKEQELLKAIQYIKENNLVQDSKGLIESNKPMRNSISYPIIFPNQKRDLNFQVNWVQGPMVYIGRIESFNNQRNKILQAKFYGMRLK